jgi:hypothetical protein
MRTSTVAHHLDTADYYGRTSARPWQKPYDELSCRGCGSSLVGRRIGVKRDTSRGIATVVETFKCRCLRERRIKREVAATS